MRFRTTLDSAGKNAAGFKVPAEVVEALGKGKRPPVLVTINGYTYRNTVAVYGDEYLIGVAQQHRGPAGVTPGDEIEVDLELDTAPREVTVPEDFAVALDGDATAKAFFDGLSYSAKSWFVLGIEDAKTPETRQRRIEKAIARLREGRAQR
ncbi:MAG TPA: YdeI/OmpD-associated family protein [Candidatus Saccharimonadales bacterium]|nr:YdeI/OmpD-associated family protein [Candidatus Saccharimonadales bacterium]